MKQRKGPDSSLSPEILKLTDKLAKDPKSKLFMPLAEEYIKSGMLDEAAMVLLDGLKIHPHFLSARVTLGKVYLEKGQIEEAKAQFEQVTAASPDNLFAHRKLARIYKDEGQLEQAKTSCQAILSLNPKDVEMKSLMEELNRLMEKPAEALVAEPPVLPEPPAAPELVKPQGPEEAAEEAAMAGVVPARESPSADEAPPAHPAEEAEEIATEALAELYIQQGYYEKGIKVYQRLISLDPSNRVLQRKLEETEAIVKRLTGGPAGIPLSQKASLSAPSGPATATAPSPSPPQPAEGAPSDEKERQRRQQIKRLEAWLENIRKGQRR